MSLESPGIRTVVLSVGLLLVGVAVVPPSSTADSHGEPVDLTFETGPDGEAWSDPEDTDFGHVAFTVFAPSDGQERPAVVTQAATPDDPPDARHVVVNRNSAGDAGWLNVRFDEPQSEPRLVFWLEPRDEQVDASGNSNVLVVRGYDSSNRRVHDRSFQITAGGYVLIDVPSPASSARISRIAVAVRPFSGQGFSRFYVSRVSFDAAPPDVDLTISQSGPEHGDAITIRADVDSPGEMTEYEWFVDGAPYLLPEDSSSPQVVRPQLSSGSHNVSVRVTDRLGLRATASRTIFVRSATDDRGGDNVLLWVGVAVGSVAVVVVARRVWR